MPFVIRETQKHYLHGQLAYSIEDEKGATICHFEPTPDAYFYAGVMVDALNNSSEIVEFKKATLVADFFKEWFGLEIDNQTARGLIARFYEHKLAIYLKEVYGITLTDFQYNLLSSVLTYKK